MLLILSAIGQKGVKMVLSWESSLVSLFKRIKVIPNGLTQRAVFALITTEQEDGRYFLLQWNPKWNCYNFIGGKVDNDSGDNNNFARAIRREIAEEIGIGNLDEIFEEREIEQINLWQFSKRKKRYKSYQFSIFRIQLFPDLPVDRQKMKRALRWLSTKHNNIYVSNEEIKRLRTSCGKPISKTVQRILMKLGEI